MLIYLPHKKATHTMFVCPAGDKDFFRNQEVPSEWVDDDNKPITFEVEFRKGRAEVDDKLGKYMTDRGLARKTKFIRPEDED